MTDTVLARLAALKTTSTPELKKQWRDLFETEPPPSSLPPPSPMLHLRLQIASKLAPLAACKPRPCFHDTRGTANSDS